MHLVLWTTPNPRHLHLAILLDCELGQNFLDFSLAYMKQQRKINMYIMDFSESSTWNFKHGNSLSFPLM